MDARIGEDSSIQMSRQEIQSTQTASRVGEEDTLHFIPLK